MTTRIAETEVAGPYVAADVAQMTLKTPTAGATAGNEVIMSSGRCLLIVHNAGGSPGTVSVASSRDPYAREQDIDAFSIPAGDLAMRVFAPVGWEQTAGGRDLLITPSATTLKIVAIPL